MAGFIVIDRKIKEWKWYHNNTALGLWSYILLEANWADCYIHDGSCIERGSFATSLPKMALETGLSESTVRRWLKRFEDDGQIEQRVTNKYRVIKVLNYSTYQDFSYGTDDSQTYSQATGQAKVKRKSDDTQNNQNNQNNNNNQKNIYTVESRQVIDYLNEKLGKHLKYTEGNLKHIRARFNEGFTLDNFKKVIDTKYSQWHSDQRMAKYLRPETLFGTKFDSYLNESGTGTNITDPSYYGEEW